MKHISIGKTSLGSVWAEKMGGGVLKHHQNGTMMMASMGNFPAPWAGLSREKDCLEPRPSSAAELGRQVGQTTVWSHVFEEQSPLQRGLGQRGKVNQFTSS